MSESNNPSVNFVTIDENHHDMRIDNFLLSRLKGVPKSRIYRILRKGEVRVNKKRVKPDYRLQENDVVRIPPVRVSEKKPTVQQAFDWDQHILYEDQGVIVINKPSGMAVHGGSGVSLGVIESLRQNRPYTPYLELVHRLDRGTSGCLMIAKKRSALRALHEALREGDVEKTYVALVKGRWQKSLKKVDAPLSKNTLCSGERIATVDDSGKHATTLFQIKQTFNDATLVEATLLTGRTHQIRVHAAHVDHPLAGDDKYGDKIFNKAMAAMGLRRLFLHACRLQFVSPATNAKVTVEATLDDELLQVLKRLA